MYRDHQRLLATNVPGSTSSAGQSPAHFHSVDHFVAMPFCCSSCTIPNMTDPQSSKPHASSSREYTSFSSILKSPERRAHESPTGWHLPSVDENGRDHASRDRSRSRSRAKDAKGGKGKDSGALSLWRMMALTVSMGGSQVRGRDATGANAQIAWTVYVGLGGARLTRRELGYGTPYLLSLGLSEQLTSLVWLAGPISGLIAQPLIGAVSDSSTSRYRRRYWIVTATMLLVFSGLGLAFTEPIAKALVDLFGGGQGDWDPKSQRLVSGT